MPRGAWRDRSGWSDAAATDCAAGGGPRSTSSWMSRMPAPISPGADRPADQHRRGAAPGSVAARARQADQPDGRVADLRQLTPAAEFNIWCDAEAAHVVFTSGIPIKMIGLNVTRQVAATPERRAQIRVPRHPHRQRCRRHARFLQRAATPAVRSAGRIDARSAGGGGAGGPRDAELRANARCDRAARRAHLRDDPVRCAAPAEAIDTEAGAPGGSRPPRRSAERGSGGRR